MNSDQIELAADPGLHHLAVGVMRGLEHVLGIDREKRTSFRITAFRLVDGLLDHGTAY
jgi:hypothetical protein